MKDNSLNKLTILAVSDKESNYLKSVIASRNFKNNFELIISCGDLHQNYITYLADGTNKIIYYVNGNHNYYLPPRTNFKNRFKLEYNSIPGGLDLHNKIIPFKNFLICGFSGSKLYNNQPYQYSEKKIYWQVLKYYLRIKWYRLLHLFAAPKKIIVISHAPVAGYGDQPDPCHSGFKAFRFFIKKLKPVLWLHGHIHLKDFTSSAVYKFKKTTIVNVYEFKKITVKQNDVKAEYKI
ncbi:MAG TPA: metallophosphoesterase [Spirochaetota bacterium]|nr:metallophosphoesterase [Spirochaetota bacterium]